MTNKLNPNFLIVVAGLCFFGWYFGDAIKARFIDGGGFNVLSPSEIAEQAHKMDAANQASVCEAFADNISRYRTNSDFQKAFQKQSVEANKEAYREFDRLIQDEIGGDNWDQSRAAALLKELAAGFRKRAK